MERMKAAVIGTSRKENEHRVPIDPRHLDRIAPETRELLWFERGYGAGFSIADEELAGRSGGVAERDELLGFPLVILPKPQPSDLLEMAEGATLWGWPHCVQQRAITQAAIDRRLTLIAFEAMYGWSSKGVRGLHVFAKNNELAGYCGVLHALELTGSDGGYGPPRKVALLGFGSVSRGAAYALLGRGFTDLTFVTQRPSHLVADQLPRCTYRRMVRGEGRMELEEPDGTRRPLRELLARCEVIVNGTLQDPERPIMYLAAGDESTLAPGTLIVDVSCDEGMGFPFARPTSFESPTFAAGPATYYAVDHTPSYLWQAASWEISEALVPYLETVMGGPEAWALQPTVERAVEIAQGVVKNRTVLSFQKRKAEYPHAPIAG